MSYVSVADVKNFRKTTSNQSGSYRTSDDETATDANLQGHIDTAIIAIEDLLSQYFVGWEGLRDTPRSDLRGNEMLLPRFRSVSKVEYRGRGENDWTQLDAGEYTTIDAERRWGASSALRRLSGSWSLSVEWRVEAVWGWGWNTDTDALDYSADPVPADIVEYTKIQVNHLLSRATSASGQVFGSAGEAIKIGSGFWHDMVFRKLRGLSPKDRGVLDARWL